MARTADAAFPAVTVDTHEQPWDPRAHLVVALERLPTAAYVWDDEDPAVVWGTPDTPGYLTPTVGTVTTPDPGPIPTQCVFVFKVRGPTGGGVVAAQFEPSGQYAWHVLRNATTATLNLTSSANGTAFSTYQVPDVAPVAGADEWRALTIDRTIGGGQQTSTAWRSLDGFTWTRGAALTSPLINPFDGNGVVRIGSDPFAQTFNGRIYAVELRTGIYPDAGTVVWRFDASDYPGTGTIYVDPRGRTWTLTAAAAITPKVPGSTSYVYDAAFVAAGYTDVWCDTEGLQIVHGEPDEQQLLAPSRAVLTLRDPGDGRYRLRDISGRLVYYAPGRRLAVWCRLTDPTTAAVTSWWMFHGRIATWREDLAGLVTIEAFASMAELAQPPGADWAAGAAGDLAGIRLAAIATRFAYSGTTRFDTGGIPLAAHITGDAPLDEMRRVAWSDGGIVMSDADDTFVFRDRNWRAGRPDQTVIPVLSDNVCDADVVLWEIEAGDDDARLASKVIFANTATPQLTATATAPYATIGANTVFTHPDDDLWTAQSDGDLLATWVLAARSEPRLAIDLARVYLHDRRYDYWSDIIDRRIGDLVRFVHEDTFGDTLEVISTRHTLATLRHLITPTEWVAELETTNATGFDPLLLWDVTTYTWDDPAADNVWR